MVGEVNAGPLDEYERRTLHQAALLYHYGIAPAVGYAVHEFEERMRAKSDDPERDEWERQRRNSSRG